MESSERERERETETDRERERERERETDRQTEKQNFGGHPAFVSLGSLKGGLHYFVILHDLLSIATRIVNWML